MLKAFNSQKIIKKTIFVVSYHHREGEMIKVFRWILENGELIAFHWILPEKYLKKIYSYLYHSNRLNSA